MFRDRTVPVDERVGILPTLINALKKSACGPVPRLLGGVTADDARDAQLRSIISGRPPSKELIESGRRVAVTSHPRLFYADSGC
jgi:hypothetical protein